MAFGIESRVPFIDHVLVEWLAILPAGMRLRVAGLNISCGRLLPMFCAKIRVRKSKLGGFATPDAAWLAGPLTEWLHSTLQAPQHLGDVVDVRGVQHL